MSKEKNTVVELKADNRTQELKDIEAIIDVLKKSGTERLEADALAEVLLDLSRGLKIE